MVIGLGKDYIVLLIFTVLNIYLNNALMFMCLHNIGRIKLSCINLKFLRVV